MRTLRPSVRSILMPLLAAPLVAQTATRTNPLPQDCLPASSYAVSAFCGFDACKAAVAAHDAAGMVQQFLARIPKETYDAAIGDGLDEMAQKVRDALAHGDVAAAAVRNLLRRPMAFGMGRLTLRGLGPSLALVVDEGGAGADLDALFATAIDHVQQLHPGVHVADVAVDGVTCRQLQGPSFPTVLYGHVGGFAVLTNSEGYLREIVATRNGRQASLASASTLGASRARLGAAPLAETFANTGLLLGMLGPVLPYEAAELSRAIGVGGLDGIYLAAAPAAGGTVETLDLGLRGSAHGALKAAFAGQADLGAAAFCGDDTLLFGSLSLDVVGAVDAFDKLFQLLPDDARRQLERNLGRGFGRAMRRAGVTPEEVRELLGALGGSVSVAATMGKGALPLPEGMLLLPVRDEAVVERWLSRLQDLAAEQAGVSWGTRDADGATIHYCSVQAGNMALSPSYVLANGYLLVSSQTRVLLRALQQKATADGSLAVTDDFAAAAAANAGATAFLHLRPSQGLERNWRMVETWLLPQLDMMEDQLGFGRDALPDQESFVRAAGEVTLSATVDDAGVRLRAASNFGLGGVLVGAATVFDELLRRAAGKVD